LNWEDDFEVSSNPDRFKIGITNEDCEAHIQAYNIIRGWAIQAAHQVQVEKAESCFPDISIDLFRRYQIQAPMLQFTQVFRNWLGNPCVFGSHRAQINPFNWQQDQISLESESYPK